MNTTAILFGILFFLNPCVGIIDIFPDFIGALLLLYGVKKALFLSEKIEAAIPKIWGLFAVSVVKTVMMLFSQGFGGSSQVLLAFAFTVGEGILLLGIIGAVSEGLELLKIRYGTVFADGAAPTDKKARKEAKFDISKFKIPITVYTVFRLVMCFLPEATELRISKPSSEETAIVALSEFKGLLYSFILPLVCIFTVFAVIRTVKTMKLYGKDKDMLSAVDSAFEKDKSDFPTRHKRKLLKTAYVMLMLSVASSVYFFADSVDMLPKVLSAASFAVLFGYFGKNLKEKLAGFAMSIALAAASGLYYSFAGKYFAEYVESNAAWLDGAKALYRPVIIIMAVQATLLFVMMIYASILLRRCGIEVFSSLDDTETTAKKIRNFKLQMTLFRVVALVFCIIAALYTPLRPTAPMILTALIGLDIVLVLSAYFVDLKL